MEWADGHDFKSEQTLQMCLTLLREGCCFFLFLRCVFASPFKKEKEKPMKLRAFFLLLLFYPSGLVALIKDLF